MWPYSPSGCCSSYATAATITEHLLCTLDHAKSFIHTRVISHTHTPTILGEGTHFIGENNEAQEGQVTYPALWPLGEPAIPPLLECPTSHSLIFETHRLIIDGRICGMALGPLSQALGKDRDEGEGGGPPTPGKAFRLPSPQHACVWHPPLPTQPTFSPPLDLKAQ